MYKITPIARKKYSFLNTVTSSKMMYKFGMIKTNETAIPMYGFRIIFRIKENDLGITRGLLDTIKMSC